jgi:hypothetical protein
MALINRQGWVRCKTVEQLALVLQRARLAPLRLHVSCPVEVGMLELISSQNFPIRSFLISCESPRSARLVDTPSFQSLNFSEIQELDLRDLSWDQPKQFQFMDWALESKCTSMTLNLGYNLGTLDLFRHKLLQKAVNIRLGSCWWIVFIDCNTH